jgi:hypothetical protein
MLMHADDIELVPCQQARNGGYKAYPVSTLYYNDHAIIWDGIFRA